MIIFGSVRAGEALELLVVEQAVIRGGRRIGPP